MHLSKSNEIFFKDCVSRALTQIVTSHDWRINIAGIALELHEKLLGNQLLNSIEARILRKRFSDDIGVSLRGLENHIDVKIHLYNELSPNLLSRYDYTTLLEIVKLKKKQNLTAIDALRAYTDISPNTKTLKLILRYSSNLHSSVNKYKSDTLLNDRIPEVIDRLKDCIELLEKKLPTP